LTVADLRIEKISPADDLELATRLLEVQHAAYAVEATLIGDDRIPPLHETVRDVQGVPVNWFGAHTPGALVGAIAWTETVDGVDIDRLVVDPAVARHGIGRALLAAVLEIADGRQVTVSTGKGNQPARSLYESRGFVHAGDIEVIPTLWVSQFVRPARGQ
jgi:GNAT superfamily N-acetyltransferase